MRPVHKELAEPVARGLLGATTVDGGPTDEQRHIIDAIVHGYFDVAIELPSLEPLDPAGLAAALDDPKARHRVVELMIVLEFSRHPGSDAMAQRVQSTPPPSTSTRRCRLWRAMRSIPLGRSSTPTI